MEADNGAVSVEKLMRRDFNLFLTDLNMPELEGAGIIRAVRQVLKELTRSSSSRPNVKSKDRERGLVRGANGYMTKPLNICEYRETVSKLIPCSG